MDEISNPRGRGMTRLEQLRLDSFLSPRELGERAGVSHATVLGLEKGATTRPHVGTLRKLAEFFDVPASELLIRANDREAA